MLNAKAKLKSEVAKLKSELKLLEFRSSQIERYYSIKFGELKAKLEELENNHELATQFMAETDYLAYQKEIEKKNNSQAIRPPSNR